MVYTKNGDKMKIMTFNLKNDTFFTHKNMRWDIRKQYVINIIRLHQPDIIGVQELTPKIKLQLSEILPEYTFIGQSRNRFSQWMNEHTDIGFRADLFDCIKQDTFWLSSHPDRKGSRIWTSIFPRICTKVQLKLKSTDQDFLIYNTHLDHLIPHSRRREMSVLMNNMQKEKESNLPMILMGDFNTTLNSRTLQQLTQSTLGMRCIYTSHMHNTIHRGTGKTNQNKQPIDYIFISDCLDVITYEIITTQFNGLYPSDHYPIVCQLQLIPNQ